MNPAQMFDAIAPGYDRLWTCAAAGRLQREAFWRCADPYLAGAARVLDIGCGTGEDACRLIERGVHVTAIDISPRMVQIARSRGVDARVLGVEEMARLDGPVDAAISNFGALNCVERISALREPMANIIRPGGCAILSFLSRFCLWETAWFASKGEPSKSLRRWSGATATSAGLCVFYPRPREIRSAFSPEFTLIDQFGIGIFVPPSFVDPAPQSLLRFAARLDRKLARKPLFRAIADHTLLILKRN